MADVTIELPKTYFRQLRLPTMGQEFERLARDAASTNQTFAQFRVPPRFLRKYTLSPLPNEGMHAPKTASLPPGLQ